MSNFPLTRFPATDTWIPETDVDGIDVGEDVIADISNFEYGNGYFESMFAPESAELPSNVFDEIDSNDFELLASKSFRHSTQGLKTVYILWKAYNLVISSVSLSIFSPLLLPKKFHP